MRPKPIAPYFGSKGSFREWIIQYFPPAKRYIEPFCGLASVLLGTERHEEEILVDSYEPAIALLQEVRDRPQELIAQIQSILLEWPVERIKSECTLPDPRTFLRESQGVARFFLHCQTSWCGGGTRWSTGVSPSSPYLNPETKGKQDLTYLMAVSDRLQGVKLHHGDGLAVLRTLEPSSELLVYCDPPYLQSARKSKDARHIAGAPRRQYAYDWLDHTHEILLALLRKGYQAILSGYENPLYRRELKGWQKEAKRVNGAAEMLWISPLAKERLPQAQLELVPFCGN